MSERHSSSKKKNPVVSKRKTTNENDLPLHGAGWTIKAVNKFFDLKTEEERLTHVQKMFSISADKYTYDLKSTVLVDFHQGNGLYCVDHNFTVKQTLFMCRQLGNMFTNAKEMVSQEDASFDKVQEDLLKTFRQTLTEAMEGGEFLYPPETAEEIVKFIIMTFLRPMRLLMIPFLYDNHSSINCEMRKISQPVKPQPLAECVQYYPVTNENEDFPLLSFPRTDDMKLWDMKQMIQQYTQSVVDIINKRYDNMEEQMKKINPLLNQ